MFIYVPWALVAVVTTALYWICTKNLDYWKKRNVPGPEPLPFFGNMIDIVLRRKHGADVMKNIYEKFKETKVVGVYRMTTPLLMVNDLDLIKDVLVKNFDTFADRGIELSEEGFGANLFNANEETWRLLRNRFSPMFTTGKLKNMFHLLDKCSTTFVDYVSRDTSQSIELDIKSILQKYTISSISACAFGVDIDLHDVGQMEIYDKIDKGTFNTTYFNEFEFMLRGILKKLNIKPLPSEVQTFFHGLVKNVLSQRNGRPSGRNDFMDLILELSQCDEVQGKDDQGLARLKITPDIIAAQAFVFYAAGYETSATTMTYMLYHLALDQGIQDKIIAEIDEVIARYDGKITYKSLSEMKYLHQAFDETLRMYPIIAVLYRSTKRDYQLPGTDVTVRKSQMVSIPLLGIQHDERYYPNPEVFNPERFTPENVRNRHPCTYLPFGAGPRNCIAMRFGKLQSQVGIVKLLSKFKLEPSTRTPIPLKFDPYRRVYSPLGSVYLNFVHRH